MRCAENAYTAQHEEKAGEPEAQPEAQDSSVN